DLFHVQHMRGRDEPHAHVDVFQVQPVGIENAHWCAIAVRPPRRTYFWILPVAVFGSASTNVNAVGTLKCASVPRANSRRSLADVLAPGRVTTNAFGDSPHFSCGTPTTATSSTAGCRSRAPSTSMDEMFSPPLMITSLNRSRISM